MAEKGKQQGKMDTVDNDNPGHERAKINKEYEEMLARLCKIKEVWCLPKEKSQY